MSGGTLASRVSQPLTQITGEGRSRRCEFSEGAAEQRKHFTRFLLEKGKANERGGESAVLPRDPGPPLQERGSERRTLRATILTE